MLSLMSVPHNPILQFYALEILKMLGVVRFDRSRGEAPES